MNMTVGIWSSRTRAERPAAEKKLFECVCVYLSGTLPYSYTAMMQDFKMGITEENRCDDKFIGIQYRVELGAALSNLYLSTLQAAATELAQIRSLMPLRRSRGTRSNYVFNTVVDV